MSTTCLPLNRDCLNLFNEHVRNPNFNAIHALSVDAWSATFRALPTVQHGPAKQSLDFDLPVSIRLAVSLSINN